MQLIDIDMDMFNSIFMSNKYLFSGVEGMIYKYNSDLLCKLFHCTYNKIINDELDYNYDLKKRIDILFSKQKYISNTLLPTGIILLNGCPISSLNPWIKNSIQLCKYMEISSNKDVLSVIKNVIINTNELYDNGIINIDLGSNNILITNDNCAHIIDLDSSFTLLDDEICFYDKMYLSSMYYGLIKEFFDLLSIRDISIINDLDSISSYKDYYCFIDSLISTKCIDKIKKRGKYGRN